MFTNNAPIGRAVSPLVKQNAILQQIARTGGLAELIKVPLNMFVSTAPSDKQAKGAPSDPFRKPHPGMWDYLVQNCNGGIQPDKSESFYVGGAAGRKKGEDGKKYDDHSDYDLKFAENIGIKFYPDDVYFDKKAKNSGPSLAMNKRRNSVIKKTTEEAEAAAEQKSTE